MPTSNSHQTVHGNIIGSVEHAVSYFHALQWSLISEYCRDMHLGLTLSASDQINIRFKGSQGGVTRDTLHLGSTTNVGVDTFPCIHAALRGHSDPHDPRLEMLTSRASSLI